MIEARSTNFVTTSMKWLLIVIILLWHTVLKPYLNVCSKVSHHSICIWGSENPYDFIQHEQDNQKLNTVCAISVEKMYVPFSLAERTITGVAYLDKLASGCYPS
jgi:hypothetical protein